MLYIIGHRTLVYLIVLWIIFSVYNIIVLCHVTMILLSISLISFRNSIVLKRIIFHVLFLFINNLNLQKMDKTNQNPLVGQCVYIVSCYQSIIGVYANIDDAVTVSKSMVAKARPCDISTQIVK